MKRTPVFGALLAAGMLTAQAGEAFASEYTHADNYLPGLIALNGLDFAEADRRFEKILTFATDAITSEIYTKGILSAWGAGRERMAFAYAQEYLERFEDEAMNDPVFEMTDIADAFGTGEETTITEVERRDFTTRYAQYFMDELNRAYTQLQGNPPADKKTEIASRILGDMAVELLSMPQDAMMLAQMALHVDPANDQARLTIASIESDAGQYARAYVYLSRIDEQSPHYFAASLSKAQMRVEEKNHEGAEKAFAEIAQWVDRQLAGLQPDSENYLQRSGELMLNKFTVSWETAKFYAEQHRYEEAVKYYDAAVTQADQFGEEATDPKAVMLVRRAQVKVDMRDLAGAEDDLREVLTLDVTASYRPHVLNAAGYTFVNEQIAVEEGLELLEEAYDLTAGRDGYIVDSYGWALFRSGRYGEAVPLLERAAELTAGMAGAPEIQYHLGESLAATGRTREAEWAYRRAVVLAEQYYPDDQDAMAYAEMARQKLPGAQQNLAAPPAP